jgi:hypothetical protein
VTAINCATPKNSVVKSTMFPHRNIHKYTWTWPEGNTHNQIDHISVDRRRHSRVLDVRSSRGAECDTDRYLVVAKARERLAVSKRAAQRQIRRDLTSRSQTRGMLKNSIGLQSETSSQLRKTQKSVGTSTGQGTILGRTSKFRPKRV